jgi:hypothetical protein
MVVKLADLYDHLDARRIANLSPSMVQRYTRAIEVLEARVPFAQRPQREDPR